MTGLLEQAVRRAEALSAEQQDAIAWQTIENIEDEEAWIRRLGSRGCSGPQAEARPAAQPCAGSDRHHEP